MISGLHLTDLIFDVELTVFDDEAAVANVDFLLEETEVG